MIFDSWLGLVRVIFIGTLSYAALILVLRISGKRALAKLNAFDLVVTVALGSTLATVLLTKDVALLEGVLAFAVLALLQFLAATVARNSQTLSRLLKSEPRVLLVDGEFIKRALAKERMAQDEVMAAVRGAGLGDLGDVAMVVLETDGSLSIISQERAGRRDALPIGARR